MPRSPTSTATSATSSTKVKSKGRVRTIKHGAAIIATGASEYKPTEYLYGKTSAS